MQTRWPELAFRARCGDAVEATFDCDPRYAGYDGILHGGIVASVLDSASDQLPLPTATWPL